MKSIKVVNCKTDNRCKKSTYKVDFTAVGKQISLHSKINRNELEIENEDNNPTIENSDLISNEIESRKLNSVERLPKESSDHLSDIFSKAINDMEDDYDDIDSIYVDNIESSLEKKIKKLNDQNLSSKNSSIKDKNINEIISLMKSKNILDDEKQQRSELLKMNDNEIEQFKDKIIKAKHVELTDSEIEANKMLNRIKNGGAIIGDFSKFNSKDDNVRNFSVDNSESMMSNEVKRTTIANNQQNQENNGLNFENFQNLQGIKKPIQVSNKQSSMREDLVSAIANLDWTTLSK